MTSNDITASLQNNIDYSMKENKQIRTWIKLLNAISFNIYKQCGKPKGRIARLVADFGGVRPLQAKWGLSLIKPNINGTFLEIGFGPGYLIYALARTIKELNASGKVYGIDHSPTMVYDAHERNEEFIQDGIVKLECADVHEIPFPDEFFDTCITVNSINFWADIPQGLSEIHRTLKKEGEFLFLESIFQENLYKDRLMKARAAGAKIYQKEQFLHYLKKTGFSTCTLYLKKRYQFLAIIAKK